MKEIIRISNLSKQLSGTIEVPGSKSESNRTLIINALSGNKSCLLNLSPSNDTKVLQRALISDKKKINIEDAGTAMRFLTAYYAATNQDKILTCDSRMKERPIGVLVDALQTLGANIEYPDKPGFPPLKINGSLSSFNKNIIKIPANISSQFVSALLLIAPVLPTGLEVELDGKISSAPYILMTLGLMQQFGITSESEGNFIRIKKQNYKPTKITIESDWSNAAYWYTMTALSNDTAIFLKGLKRNSIQGDSVIKELFLPFGIITEFSDTGIFITKASEDFSKLPEIIDFSDHPDLAQTLIVLCAAKGIHCKFTGMESLRIKETDRIKALQNELLKFDISLIEESKGVYALKGVFNSHSSPTIETYNDHRMAMAFAPLSLPCENIAISDPSCVNKSYQGFWEDMKLLGFNIQFVK